MFYALLILPWPGLDRVYLAWFRAAGNVLFGSFGPGGTVQFEPESPPDDTWSTKITFQNRRAGMGGGVFYKSRQGYLTIALAAALILATPIPPKRRWKALLAGLILANAFVALRVYLGLLDIFSGDNPLALYTFGPFWKGALRVAVEMFTVSPEFTFVVPVFIWIAAAVRRRDIERWREAL